MPFSSPLANVICNLGTVKGLINDLTTGDTWGAGNTGELAHNAADVNCVTRRADDDSDGPDDVRNTLRSFDFKPNDNKIQHFQ